jgi:hypothetical protein
VQIDIDDAAGPAPADSTIPKAPIRRSIAGRPRGQTKRRRIALPGGDELWPSELSAAVERDLRSLDGLGTAGRISAARALLDLGPCDGLSESRATNHGPRASLVELQNDVRKRVQHLQGVRPDRSWAARSALVSDMNVVCKQFANPGKRAKRPHKGRGPPAGILTKLIDFDPLDESVARAIGCEPAELDKMTVAKGLTWRAGVECVISNSSTYLRRRALVRPCHNSRYSSGRSRLRPKNSESFWADTKILQLRTPWRNSDTDAWGFLRNTRQWRN